MATPRDDDSVAEQLLVLRAQLGSRDAYARLAARYDARLLFYLRRLLGPAEDLEDIRQEVWLIVIRKLRTLEEPAAFRTWLYRIARHQAISFFRRKRPQVSLDELAPHEQPLAVADADTEGDIGYAAQDAVAVYGALDRLSPGFREILTLRFLSELTYEQIAEVLGCRVGTVRSRLHYAKAALRTAISGTAAGNASDHETSPERGYDGPRPTR